MLFSHIFYKITFQISFSENFKKPVGYWKGWGWQRWIDKWQVIFSGFFFFFCLTIYLPFISYQKFRQFFNRMLTKAWKRIYLRRSLWKTCWTLDIVLLTSWRQSQAFTLAILVRRYSIKFVRTVKSSSINLLFNRNVVFS